MQMLNERSGSRRIKLIGFAVLAALVLAGNALLLHWPENPLLRGQPQPDWPYFFDLLVTLPLLYALLRRPGWRRWLQVTLTGFAAGYLLGHVLIPDPLKVVWHQAATLRYVILTGIVVVELLLAWRVLQGVLTGLRLRQFADDAIEVKFATLLGEGAFSRLLAIEYRVWYYALLHRERHQIVLDGDQHFSTHRKDANQADQLGFIFLVLLELPVLHLVLAGYDLTTLAWVLTAVSLYGLLFLIAEYRATALRPVSLSHDELIIRRGVWGLRRLPFALIQSVDLHRGELQPSPQIENYDANREPNIVLNLLPDVVLPKRFFGSKPLQQIALGLDEPGRFLSVLNERLRPSTCSEPTA